LFVVESVTIMLVYTNSKWNDVEGCETVTDMFHLRANYSLKTKQPINQFWLRLANLV